MRFIMLEEYKTGDDIVLVVEDIKDVTVGIDGSTKVSMKYEDNTVYTVCESPYDVYQEILRSVPL